MQSPWCAARSLRRKVSSGEPEAHPAALCEGAPPTVAGSAAHSLSRETTCHVPPLTGMSKL